MGKFGYRAYLDGLRGISIFAVVLFHSGIGQFREGYLGVDVFFVLSGYLITSIMLVEIERKGTLDLFRFYARRARRILPGAAIALLIISILERFIDVVVLADHRLCMLSAASYCANVCFIYEGTDYWAVGKAVNPIKHYWSLSIEEQFYLMYPFGLLVILKLSKIVFGGTNTNTNEEKEEKSKRGKESGESKKHSMKGSYVRFLTISLIVLIFCAILSFLYNLYLARYKTLSESHMNSFGRIYQLFSGGILAIILIFWKNYELKVWKRAMKYLYGFTVLFILVLMFHPILFDIYVHPSHAGAVMVVLCLCLIFSLESDFTSFENVRDNNEVVKNEFSERVKSAFDKILESKVFIYIGKWSYSIYLWHFPLIVFCDYLNLLPSVSGEEVIRRLIYICIGSILLGLFSYYVFEQTFMRFLKIDTKFRKKVLTSMGIIIPLSVVIVLYLFILPKKIDIGGELLSGDDIILEGGDNYVITTVPNIIPSDVGDDVIEKIVIEDNLEPKDDDNDDDDEVVEEMNDVESKEIDFYDGDENFIGTEVLVYGDSTCLQASEMWKGLSKKKGFNMVDGCHNGRKPVLYPGNHPELESNRFNDYKPDLIILYGTAVERECVNPRNGWWYHRGSWKDKNCGPVDHEGFERWIGGKIGSFLETLLDPTESVPIVVFAPMPRAGKEVPMSSINDDPEHLQRGGDRNPAGCLKKIAINGEMYRPGDCDNRMYHPYYYMDVVKSEIAIAKKRGNMKVVNMEQFLCPGGICPAKYKGQLVMWKDYQHVTSDYWIRVASEFMEFLREHGIFLTSKEKKDELLSVK